MRIAKAPNAPLPKRMRRMVEIIDQLPQSYPVERLWICNTNSFYGYVAKAFERSGSSVNFFEEGLGTYRSIDDPPFKREPLAPRIRHLYLQVHSVLVKPRLTMYRRLRRVGHHVGRFVSDTDLGRAYARLVVREARAFQEPRTSFDRAVVAFPEHLDERLISASVYERMEMNPDGANVGSEPTGSGHASPFGRPLFLSQRYGVPYEPWARAIASALAELDVQAIALKHHPRETERERADLTLALIRAGLAVLDDPDFDHWTSEQFIVQHHVDDVIGLTSSTLIYQPYTSWAVRYRSIGYAVLDRLRADADVHPDSLIQLSGDLRLLRRVLPSSAEPLVHDTTARGS